MLYYKYSKENDKNNKLNSAKTAQKGGNIMKRINVRIASPERKKENKAIKALNFIINSNGGLTDNQIEALQELIDGGFIEAINDYELKIHN